MDRECEIWNIGATLNAFVISARSPEKLWLLRNTSRWTSFAIPSMVPGFDNPNASLRSWNPIYVLANRWTTAFSVKKLRGSLSFSENVAMVGEGSRGGEEEKGRRLWEGGRDETLAAEAAMEFVREICDGCWCWLYDDASDLRRNSTMDSTRLVLAPFIA